MSRTLTVAIDVSALSDGLRSGTAVYVYHLVRGLGSLEGAQVHALYNGMPGEGEALARSLEGSGVRVTSARLRWPLLPGPFFTRPYPRVLHQAVLEADVFHVGEFVYPRPRPGQAVVATVHDVTTRLFPEWHNLPNRVLHRRRLAWISRNATRILIDAEATRHDTARHVGVPPQRLHVVRLARGTAKRLVGAAEVAGIRGRLGLGGGPYVLYVGTLEPRKNLVRLVQAFRSAAGGSAVLRLVLGGSWGWHTGELRAAVRASGSRVIVTGPLEAPAQEALYAGATIFAYPSLYEGFGLPLLEAMSAGIPVITSRGGALEELAGGAARLIDPLDVAGIAAAIRELFDSPGERERLAALGTERERQFSWEKTAAETLGVYLEAAREAGRVGPLPAEAMTPGADG